MATTSVQNAFLVLETVADLQPAGLTAVARVAGLPKSTTQRMLLTLAEVGWLRATDDSPTRWVLTYRALRVAGQVDGRHGLRESALPEMSALQHATTETVHLTAPDGDHLVLLERLDTPHHLRAFLPLGERIPYHASATGQAYLAASTDLVVDRLTARPLDARTSGTITDPVLLRARLEEIRERGWSINVGGLSSGITALGAAIVGHDGLPLGAVSVSGPSSRITADRFADLGAAVARSAARISGGL